MDKRLTLSLPEAVLLIAIDERSGAVRGAGELHYGLAGAMLIELSLHGRLVCAGRNLMVVDRLRTGDPLLDEVLSMMRRAAAPRPVRSWLLRITRAIHDLLPRYLDRLAQAEIVRHEQARAQGFFSTDYYPLLALGSRYGLTERLRQIALADAPAEPREVALLRLLEACGLLDGLFARAEMRLARSRVATHSTADRLGVLIAAEVASLRQDSADFVSGNELGLTEIECRDLEPKALAARLEQIEQRLRQAGAHYVVETIADVLPILDAIEARLRQGDQP